MGIRLLWFGICALSIIGVHAALPQKSATDPVNAMTYENRNQIDPKPLRLRSVRGIALDDSGALIPGVTVGIFADANRSFIASTESNGRGKFYFSALPAGKYRLVAKHPAFCTANVPIIIDSATEKGRPAKAIRLHMRLGGIDTCSFGSLK